MMIRVAGKGQFILLVTATLLKCGVWAEQAGAQEALGEVRFIRNPVQAFTKGPGGSKKGELYLNTGVIVTEERGDWAKVTVEGWVRKDSLKQSAESRTTPLQNLEHPPLEITGFSTKQVEDGLPSPRVYLNLKLKNFAKEPVLRWSGLLVAQSKNGAVLFRQPVSDDQAKIPAEGEGEVSFYWEEKEDPYSTLLGASPESIKLELYKVEVNK